MIQINFELAQEEAQIDQSFQPLVLSIRLPAQHLQSFCKESGAHEHQANKSLG